MSTHIFMDTFEHSSSWVDSLKARIYDAFMSTEIRFGLLLTLTDLRGAVA